MKNLSLVISWFLFSSILVAQSDSTQVFDLEQCIQYAFDHQQDVKSATLDIQNAEYQKKEAIGIGLPQVHGKMQTLDNINLQQQFLPANAFDPTAPSDVVSPVGFGVQYTNDVNVTATQLLFDGSYLAGVKASKVYIELFSKSLTRTKVDVVENVAKAYCGVLVAHERVVILERDSEILEELITDTRVRYENGFAEEIDVQRLEVQRNNILVELANLVAFEEISYKILKFQMGMDVNEGLIVSGDLEEVFETAIAKSLPDPDAKNRIEYQVLESNKRVNEINVDYNVAQGLPRLALFGSVGYNTGAINTGELFKPNNYESYSRIGLQLDVPIFQGLSKTNRVNQAKIAVQKTELDIAKFELSVGLEYAQAKANFEVNMKKIAFHKQNIALAANVSKTTKIKYQQGIGSNYELTDAVSSYLDAQTNYYIAIYDAMISYIELQKSLGVLYQE
jgi:outer membrane protein